MVSLADLNPTPVAKPTLADFNPLDNGIAPSVINPDTSSNIAAHAAVLDDPANVLKSYHNINTELSTGNSTSLNSLLDKRETIDQQGTYDALQKALVDPSLSTDQKTSYLDGYIGMTQDRPGTHSLNVLVAKQAAMSASTPDETDEAIKTLLPSDASTYDQVDEYNGWVQKQINAFKNSTNDNFFTSSLNLIESMVPFASQLGNAKTEAALNLVKSPNDLVNAMVLMGENKAGVRQMIAEMPISKKYEFAKKLIDVVKNTGGSITGRPDSLAQIGQLQSFLQSGSYSGQDRLTDNIFSVLDTTFLLSPLSKLFKGAETAAEGAAALKRAAIVDDKTIASATPDIKETIDSAIPSGPKIFVNSEGKASTDINKVQQTVLPNDGSVIHVNSAGEAFLTDPKTISDDVVQSVREQVAKTIADKFKTPMEEAQSELPFFITKKNTDYLSSGEINSGKVEDDLIARFNSVITKDSLTDPDLVKKINDVASEVLKSNRVQTPKTFKATATQLVNKIYKESFVSRLSVRTDVAPTSLSQTLKDVNPQKARNIFNMVVNDQSDQAAKVLYGTDRADAIANDLLPEVENADGSVRNKVAMVDESGPNPSQKVIQASKENTGRIDLAPSEKDATREDVKNNFRDVVGMVPRTSMGTVGDPNVLIKEGSVDTPTGVTFDMVYGPKDGGFISRKQAVEQAEFSLRKYGVTSKEIEILGKDSNGTYIPALPTKSYDSYLIRVKHDFEFTPADTVEHAVLDNSNWKIFDSRESWTDGRMGGLLQHFVPNTAIINRVLMNSATRAADKSAWYSKKLIDLASEYAKKYMGLSKRQKALVDDYIVEANNKGLKFDPVNLQTRGFDERAIDTIRSWKTTTDTMWWLENVDVNKTAAARGWQRFVDQTNKTDLLARPVPNRFGNGVKAYNSLTDKVENLSKDDLNTLYENGGTIAKTRDTIPVGDDVVDYIIATNKSDGSYLRRIRHDDITLPYRDGYYPIKYTDTHFIEQTFTKADGSIYKKAIATAGTYQDAKRLFDRIVSSDNKGVYHIRNDYKLGSDTFDEAQWSYLNTTGRSSQRVRGQRLASGSQITDPDHIHVEAPEESLINSIRSVAARTAFRDWTETTKNRWMAHYGDLIDEREGQQVWPNDVRQIGADKLEKDSMRVKNAKTTWRFVRAMEAGYVNLLDDASKNFFKIFSDTAGRKGWGWLEKVGLQAAKGSPIGFARKKAFKLLLAANPLRQAPVQAMQALPVMLATNPLAIPRIAFQIILLNYLKTGGDAQSFMKVMARLATGLTPEEAVQLAKHYEMSGFEAAVDANSLIRDQLGRLVDRSSWQKTKSLIGAPLNFTQKIGFNAGENLLMRTIWLSEYDTLRRSGKVINAETLDNLSARVRNLTLNMNKAGELPYNENMFSAALQFFQAPHKAFAQILMGHTGLTAADRIRLGAAYVTTYGIGAGGLTSLIMKQLNSDPNIRDTIEGGVFNLALDNALSHIFNENVKTDFSDSFRLLQFPDLQAFWHGLIENNVASVLTQGASIGLVLGDSPRITNFVKQMLRVFMVDNSHTADELALLGKDFLKMFSGGSSFFKARYAWEWHKSMNTKGSIADYHVNDVEAVLKLAGFNTVDEINQYAFNEASYQATGQFKNDIAYVIDETSRHLADQDISQDSAGWYLSQMAEAQRVFGNDPVYMKEFSNQLKYKATTRESSIFITLLRQSGYTNPADFTDLVQNSHLDDDMKKTLLDAKKLLENTKNGN